MQNLRKLYAKSTQTLRKLFKADNILCRLLLIPCELLQSSSSKNKLKSFHSVELPKVGFKRTTVWALTLTATEAKSLFCRMHVEFKIRL